MIEIQFIDLALIILGFLGVWVLSILVGSLPKCDGNDGIFIILNIMVFACLCGVLIGCTFIGWWIIGVVIMIEIQFIGLALVIIGFIWVWFSSILVGCCPCGHNEIPTIMTYVSLGLVISGCICIGYWILQSLGLI